MEGGFSAESIDTLRNHDSARLKAAVAEVGEAYKRAVDFLATHIGVPNGDVIPYANQMTVLGEICRTIPAPNAAQFKEVERWFWRTAISGHFGGWNTGMMAEDLLAVQMFAQGQHPDIRVTTSIPGTDLWSTKQFRGNNAHAKLLAIVLSHHRPIDMLSGQRLDTDKALAWSNVKRNFTISSRMRT